jgi:hypothetical protein
VDVTTPVLRLLRKGAWCCVYQRHLVRKRTEDDVERIVGEHLEGAKRWRLVI